MHLLEVPTVKDYNFDEKVWNLFFEIKADVNKTLATAISEKAIVSSLEAEDKLNLPEKYNVVKNVIDVGTMLMN